MLTLGWALAGLIGALAGVLVSPSTFLYPNSMDSIFVLGFTAAVLGGLDSPIGAVVGGLCSASCSTTSAAISARTWSHLRAAAAHRGAHGPAAGLFAASYDAAGVTMIDRLTDRRTERGARTAANGVAAPVRRGILAVILLALINVSGSFRDYQIAEVAVYVVAVAGLTFLIGLSGQISIGNGAFMAVGAYVAALLIIHLNWPLPVVLVAAAAATALVGGVLGVAAARLRGPYLAGATLIFAVALPSLANRYASLLGGDQGLSVNITVPSGLGASFPLTRWQAWITCATALVTLVLLANLASSRIGRSWRAVRDDEVAAALAGLNVARLRVLAFVVSAASAGLAGALLAITTGLVAPTCSHWRCPSGCSPPPWSAAWAAWRAPCGAASCLSSCPPTPPTSRQAMACRARSAPTSRSSYTAWRSSSS